MPIRVPIRLPNRLRRAATPAVPQRRSSLTDVTAVMTAFRRPRCVERQVASLRRFYPGLPVIIGDNGDSPAGIDDPRVTYLRFPFDLGIAASRNRLVQQCRTPFILLLDDDYVWTDDTQIERFLDVLDSDPEVGGVGGWCDDVRPDRRCRIDWALDLEIFRGELRTRNTDDRPHRIARGGTAYRYCDTVLNFALFRREMLNEHRWDERLKLQEHWDFYLSVKQAGRWRVAFTPEVSMRHERDRPPENYQSFRGRSAEFMSYLLRKWGLRSVRLIPFRETGPAAGGLPNAIVLTPGHTGSSIVTWMLHSLGWNAPPDADEFAEPVAIRRLNERCLSEGRLDERAAQQALAQLPQPWALKDPRFADTLRHWLSLLGPYRPALLYLTKPLDEVRASCIRRGERLDVAEARFHRCAEIVRRWPWRTHTLDYHALRRAVAGFDAARHGHDGHGVSLNTCKGD